MNENHFVAATCFLLLLATPNPTQAAADNTLGVALLSASVDANGALVRGSGVTNTSRITTGRYQVTFNRDVTQCTYSATVGVATGAFTLPDFIQATPKPDIPNAVLVETDDKTGALNDDPFHLLVFCPQ